MLQEWLRKASLAYHKGHEGKVVDVLVEGWSRHDPGIVCGRTSSAIMVNFPGTAELTGKTVRVKVTRAFTNTVRGEPA